MQAKLEEYSKKLKIEVNVRHSDEVHFEWVRWNFFELYESQFHDVRGEYDPITHND